MAVYNEAMFIFGVEMDYAANFYFTRNINKNHSGKNACQYQSKGTIFSTRRTACADGNHAFTHVGRGIAMYVVLTYCATGASPQKGSSNSAYNDYGK